MTVNSAAELKSTLWSYCVLKASNSTWAYNTQQSGL